MVGWKVSVSESWTEAPKMSLFFRRLFESSVRLVLPLEHFCVILSLAMIFPRFSTSASLNHVHPSGAADERINVSSHAELYRFLYCPRQLDGSVTRPECVGFWETRITNGSR